MYPTHGCLLVSLNLYSLFPVPGREMMLSGPLGSHRGMGTQPHHPNGAFPLPSLLWGALKSTALLTKKAFIEISRTGWEGREEDPLPATISVLKMTNSSVVLNKYIYLHGLRENQLRQIASCGSLSPGCEDVATVFFFVPAVILQISQGAGGSNQTKKHPKNQPFGFSLTTKIAPD